mgnify:CR=1 FL=1
MIHYADQSLSEVIIDYYEQLLSGAKKRPVVKPVVLGTIPFLGYHLVMTNSSPWKIPKINRGL